MYNDITGIILSGGKSTRMGTNKSLLKLGDQTVIERIVNLMKPLFGRVILSTNSFDEYRFLGLEMFEDIYNGFGPIGGIHSGLVHSQTEKNFIISCDIPLISAGIIKYLIDYATDKPITIAKADGFIQQLSGVYCRSILNEIEKIILQSETEVRNNEQTKRKCSVHKLIENDIVTLLAHPGNNSLPASLEILARLQQDGERGKIIYLDDNTNKNWQNELEKIVKHLTVFHNLRKTKIGLIGDPSDWLVASIPEFDTIKKNWGPTVIKIEMEELKSLIAEIKDEQISDNHHYFIERATEVKEPSKKELKSVVKVYAALKQLIRKYELTSVSVRCFDLVTDLKTTGCYALSKLNDDGTVAGCEGDLVSTLGMMWANYLTDQIVWMANPAQLDESNNSIWFAHCTVPMSMVENYKLRSHFESGLGVGIQGELSKGKVTVLRIGGKHLDKIWVSNGEILEAGSSENLCRTQVKVKLHGAAKASDLLTSPLGNHILLMRGSHAKELMEWWELFIAN